MPTAPQMIGDRLTPLIPLSMAYSMSRGCTSPSPVDARRRMKDTDERAHGFVEKAKES